MECTKDGFVCLSNDLSLFNSLLGKNLIFADTKEISGLFLPKRIDYKEIRIEKKLPNKLEINIIARKPAAVYQTEEGSFFIDDTGFIFSVVYQIREKKPVIIAPDFESAILGNFASQNTQRALKLVKSLDYGYLPFKTLTITKDGDVKVAGSGWEALMSLKKDFNVQVSSLQLILRSSTIVQDGSSAKKISMQKIDLRFEKPVVSTIYE
jgi:hypothetical protein